MGDEGKKFEGIFKALGKYAEHVASQILTNFKAEDIAKQIQLYEEKAVNVVQSFGTGRDRIVELKASMADAVVSVTELGGGLEDVAKIAQSVGENLNRNIILTKESYKDLYATAKVTGVQYETLIPKFKDAGFSVYQISENMKKVVDTATASGVNAQKVSSMVVSNMSLMDKYNFAGGVEGLAKMATQAVNLRISADQIERVMDKAFNPDSAIEMAASLQRLGVAQSDLLDPLRLMDLAQNDPAELQNQIVEMSKSFVEFDEKSKSFQIAPGAKRQLQEVASAMGMNASELAKMAKGAAELEDKMNKIHFPGDMFTEDQKTMIANMAEMGPGGEYMLRVDNKDLKLDEAMKLFQEQPKLLEKFTADSKPKSMEEMAKQQLTLSERGTKALESLANRFGAAQASTETQEMAMQAQLQVTESITKLFGGEKLQVPAIRQTTENIEQGLIKGVQSGDITGSLSRAKEEGRKYLDQAFDDVVGGGTKALQGLKESTNPLINIMTNLGTQTFNAITNHEKLNGTFGTLNTTIDNTNKKLGQTTPITTVTATATPTNTENKELKTASESKQNTETQTSEFKFNPLEIKLTISGLLPGMSEDQIKQLIIDGKLNEAIYNAVKDAEKTKVK